MGGWKHRCTPPDTDNEICGKKAVGYVEGLLFFSPLIAHGHLTGIERENLLSQRFVFPEGIFFKFLLLYATPYPCPQHTHTNTQPPTRYSSSEAARIVWEDGCYTVPSFCDIF